MTTPETSTPTSGRSADSNVSEHASVSGGSSASRSASSPDAVPSRRHPTSSEHAAALTIALSTLAEQMSQIEWGAEHLSCSEAEAIADVLILTGHADAAASLREFHSHGDDDSNDQHHARYHELAYHDDEQRHRCCGPDTSDQLTDRIKEER